MFTFEEVADYLDDLVDELPEELLQGLNGGINLQPELMYNARIPSPEYVVLGNYNRHPQMGCFINLYYNSFMALYVDASVEEMKAALKKTLLHELRHHLESRSGVRDLEKEDEKYVMQAIERINKRQNQQ